MQAAPLLRIVYDAITAWAGMGTANRNVRQEDQWVFQAFAFMQGDDLHAARI